MARNFRDKYQHEFGIAQQSDEPRPHPGVIVGGEAGREKRREYAIVFGSKIFGSIAAVWWMFTYDTGWVEWSAFIAGYIILMLGIDKPPERHVPLPFRLVHGRLRHRHEHLWQRPRGQ